MYILIIRICIRLSFVVTEEQLSPIVKLAAKIRNLSELCNFYTPFLCNSTADTMFGITQKIPIYSPINARIHHTRVLSRRAAYFGE